MRAVVITRPGGVEVLEVREVETPEPVGDQVRVRVHAAGLNRADLAQRRGFYPAPPGSPSDIPGMEFAGTVDKLGPLATQARVGQRVMGLAGGGAQAEYILVHDGLLVEIPERLDFVQAAGVPEVFITAHDALFTQARLSMGERVLIHAAGSGVGTAAVQLAHATGAVTYGTSRTPEKLERAKTLGLAFALPAGDFAAEVRRLTEGAGVHVVLDTIGAAYLAQNIDALGPWGRMVCLATMGGSEGTISLGLLMGKRLTVRGSTMRSRTLEEKLTATRLFATHVLPLLADGTVRPIIERAYPLDEIRAAHEALERNTAFGKIVVTLD